MENIEAAAGCINMGGFKAVYLTTIEEIKSINKVDAQKRTITFENGGAFGKIDLYDITVNSEPAGDAWTHTINGKMRTSSSMHDVLHILTRKRFVAMVIDNNGSTHLIGSKDEPLRFSFAVEGPADPEGDKHYNITIVGSTTEPQRDYSVI
jgi:hypothetical protein